MKLNAFSARLLCVVAALSLMAATPASQPASQPAPPNAPMPQQARPFPPGGNVGLVGGGNNVRAVGVMNGGAPDPKKIEAADRRMYESAIRQSQNSKEVETHQIGDLFHCSLEDGRINIQVDQNILSGNMVQNRVKILGLTDPLADSAKWKMQVFITTIPGPNGAFMQSKALMLFRDNFDQDKPGEMWEVWFQEFPGRITFGATGIGLRVTCAQDPQTTQLIVTLDGKTTVYAGNTLLDLAQQHPVEARKYLSPILLRITGRDWLQPGPGDVYGAFTQIAADPKVAGKVADLLAQMDSDSFDKREAASAALAKLGEPGLIAVLRLDRSKLSQEQKTRCDAFLRTGQVCDFDNPADALHDVNFLLDAMNHPDPRVRELAKKTLENLQGHPVDIDVSEQGDAAARQVAIDKSRADYEEKNPSTQPQQQQQAMPALQVHGNVMLRMTPAPVPAPPAPPGQ